MKRKTFSSLITAATLVISILPAHADPLASYGDEGGMSGANGTSMVGESPTVNQAATISQSNAQYNYRVPGEIAAIAQPTDMTCWAAAVTTMVSWRDQASHTIEEVMDQAGQFYHQKFKNNEVLYSDEESKLFAALGMTEKAPQNYSVEGVLSLLRNHGPIFVIGNEGSTGNPALHARVIIGMFGDGTPDGTSLEIADPDGGQKRTESLRTFAQKYESVAEVDTNGGFELRIQVAHF